MTIVCPLCHEGMVQNSDYWKCHGCGAELWPDLDIDLQLRETWAQQQAEGGYGNPRSGGGSGKRKGQQPARKNYRDRARMILDL